MTRLIFLVDAFSHDGLTDFSHSQSHSVCLPVVTAIFVISRSQQDNYLSSSSSSTTWSGFFSKNVLLTSKEGKRQPTLSKVKTSLYKLKLVKNICAVGGYGCRTGRVLPKPARNSSRVAASVIEVGNKFHSLMVFGKKEVL